jgi:transcriptional regulator with XRE-family HTH domain
MEGAMLIMANRKKKIMPVRTRLKDLREQRGIPRMKIVREADMSYQTILKWENEILKELDTAVLHALLDYLDVTYEELIYEVPSEETPVEPKKKGKK